MVINYSDQEVIKNKNPIPIVLNKFPSAGAIFEILTILLEHNTTIINTIPVFYDLFNDDQLNRLFGIEKTRPNWVSKIEFKFKRKEFENLCKNPIFLRIFGYF